MKSTLTLVVLCASALLTGVACNSQFIRGQKSAEFMPNSGATSDIDNPNSTGTTLELGSAVVGTAPVNAGARSNFNPQPMAKEVFAPAPVAVPTVETAKVAPAVEPVAPTGLSVKQTKILPLKRVAIAPAAPKKAANIAKTHHRQHRAVAATTVTTKKSVKAVKAHKKATTQAGETEPIVVAPVVRHATTFSGATTSAAAFKPTSGTNAKGTGMDYLDRNGYRNRANNTGTQWADPVFPTTEELLKQND